MADERDPLLTETQTAELLGLKPQSLSVWRCTKRYALPWVKVGRLVRYRHSDVLRFLENRTIRPVDTAA